MKASTTLTIATFILLSILLSILSAVLGWMGRGSWERRHSLPPQIDTVWRYDTVRLVDSKPVGAVTAKLPVARPEVARDDNLLADSAIILQKEPLDTAADHLRDSTQMVQPSDSVQVEVPIEQRTYEGENYRAVVQGFRPKLVSIDIRFPEIAAPAPPAKRWHFTVGVQLGYGFTPAGWQPYAGAGWTFGYSF